MARQDIRQDDNGDIYINTISGDFAVISSDNQHVGDILQSANGDYKEFPLVGVNFYKFANSSNQNQNLERIIRTQLVSDGYQVTNIDIPLTVTSLADMTVYADAPNV